MIPQHGSDELSIVDMVSRLGFGAANAQSPMPVLPSRNGFHSQPLVQNATPGFIIENYGPVIDAWIQLQEATTFPDNISSTDSRVVSAFRSIFDAIYKGGIISRMAHVQLLSVFCALERLVGFERKLGLHPAARNSKIAIDKFIVMAKPTDWPRSKVNELRRTARRWKHLAGQSVFSLMVYSESAESTM